MQKNVRNRSNKYKGNYLPQLLSKNTSPVVKRISIVMIVIVTGVAIGYCAVRYFATGLHPEPSHALVDSLGSSTEIGGIEAIQMPLGARRLKDVKSFVIENSGFDDFGKIYANNYLVSSSEDRSRIFIGFPESDKDAKDIGMDYSRVRNNEIPSPKDIVVFLRTGLNYIVYELENNKGACMGGVRITVNGIELQSSPQRILDEDFVPDPDVTNEFVQTKLSNQGVDPFERSICSRRIWEFVLE